MTVVKIYACNIRGIFSNGSAGKESTSNAGDTGDRGSVPGERLLLNYAKKPGFLAPRREEFNLGPEMSLDHSELLCNKVLLKCKGDRESF